MPVARIALCGAVLAMLAGCATSSFDQSDELTIDAHEEYRNVAEFATDPQIYHEADIERPRYRSFAGEGSPSAAQTKAEADRVSSSSHHDDGWERPGAIY